MASATSFTATRIVPIEDAVIVGGDIDGSGNLTLTTAGGDTIAIGNVGLPGADGADGAPGATGATGATGPAGSGVGPVLLGETVVSNYTGGSVGSSPTDWPGFSVTFTKGAKPICVRISCHLKIASGPGTMILSLYEGSTLIQSWTQPSAQNGVSFNMDKETITLNPSTGSHTYKVAISTTAGTVQGVATPATPTSTPGNGFPAFIKVVEQ